MRIVLVRTGGVTGVRFTASVDTQTLPEEEAAKLMQWVSQARFFNLPASIQPATQQPDRFQYTLTVEDGSRKNTVSAAETALPAGLKPLVDYLVQQARKQK